MNRADFLKLGTLGAVGAAMLRKLHPARPAKQPVEFDSDVVWSAKDGVTVRQAAIFDTEFVPDRGWKMALFNEDTEVEG